MTIVIRTVCYKYKNRQTDQNQKTPETDPHTRSHLIYDKRQHCIAVNKEKSFQNIVLGQLRIHKEKKCT